MISSKIKQIPAVFKQIRHFSSTCDAFCATNGLSQRSCGVLLEKWAVVGDFILFILFGGHDNLNK